MKKCGMLQCVTVDLSVFQKNVVQIRDLLCIT